MQHGPLAGGPPRSDRILNAFWSQSDNVLTVVRPDPASPSGVGYDRHRAEHSCFIRRDDCDDDLMRLFKRHSAVRKVELVEADAWVRVHWRERNACRRYCEALHQKGIQTYDGAINPVLRFMVDRGLMPARPRKVWIDLETDSRVPFSRKVEMRILSWVAVDESLRVVGEGLLAEDTDKDEARLLGELWAVLDQYDLVAAWSGDRFDFPIIKHRSEGLGLLRPALRDWRRWLWLDHLDLFERMNISASESGDEKQSFALGAIGMAVLGEGKADFDSSRTWEAWESGDEGRRRLLAYNRQDTTLMPRIEERTGYVELLLTLGEVCGTFADSRGINPSTQVEGFLQRLAHARGHKFPSAFSASGDQYLGAYVMQPRAAGILRDVHVADFASLYPSIIRTWNMSPETVVEGDRPGTSLSPLTGVRFTVGTEGILPSALRELMRLRKEWNERKAAAAPGTPEWKDADRRSTAYKIAANSFYGVVGATTSPRFFRRQVAESVTQCGAWLIKLTIAAAEERKMEVVYADTDSLFVVGAPRSQFERFVEWCNAELYPAELRKVGCVENFVKLAYEKQFDRLVFTTAKRYAGSFAHYKGKQATADSKPEIKGLEYKRGDGVRLARQLQQEVVHMLVGYGREPCDAAAEYQALLDRWCTRVLEQPLDMEDVLISKRLNKPLGAYEANQAFLRIARELEERGRDVAEGAKIDYVVVDAYVSPQVVVPAEDWPAEVNRFGLWDKHVFPPTLRLLEAAFPGESWARWAKTRPPKQRAPKGSKRAPHNRGDATAEPGTEAEGTHPDRPTDQRAEGRTEGRTEGAAGHPVGPVRHRPAPAVAAAQDAGAAPRVPRNGPGPVRRRVRPAGRDQGDPRGAEDPRRADAGRDQLGGQQPGGGGGAGQPPARGRQAGGGQLPPRVRGGRGRDARGRLGDA